MISSRVIVPTLPPFFPPFLNPTLPTFPTTSLVSSTSQLPYPTVPPTSQPHPVFKRDYGALHYDEYDENHFIEYHHYHDNLQDDEEAAVVTIKGTNRPMLRLPTLLPSTLLPIEVETFHPSPHQDAGLDLVVDLPLPPPRSSASASSTSGGIFLTTLFLFRGTILWQHITLNKEPWALFFVHPIQWIFPISFDVDDSSFEAVTLFNLTTHKVDAGLYMFKSVFEHKILKVQNAITPRCKYCWIDDCSCQRCWVSEWVKVNGAQSARIH